METKKTPIDSEIKVVLLTILKDGYVTPTQKELLYNGFKMAGYGSFSDIDLSVFNESEKLTLLELARKIQN
jgi:hypothetical protein